MKYCFGDIVVVDGNYIGVVVKSWIKYINNRPASHNYDVYVRTYDSIVNYTEEQIERYMVRHKYLNEEEAEYQYNAVNGI